MPATYACYDLAHDLGELKTLIDSFSHLYNTYKPHCASRRMTPAEYLHAITAKENAISHIS